MGTSRLERNETDRIGVKHIWAIAVIRQPKRDTTR
jgi:hypothetical protein